MNAQLLVIQGPTAVGKSDLALAMAQKWQGEIISADSMQIYRGMNIGTAKPTVQELSLAPHHLIDVADPSDSWSVSRWVDAAIIEIEDVLSRHKLPIVIGGTGLYVDSLLSGRDFSPAPENPETRAQLLAEYDAIGGEAFRQKLAAVDPERAEKLAPGDRKRLVRAMEVYLLSGETITAHDKRTQALPPRYSSLRFALAYHDRETLYQRIDLRVDRMLEQGLVQEVEALLQSGLSDSTTAMQAIGYKEIVAALRGQCSLEEAVAQIKQESRRYAKRQLTWLRHDPELHWLFREDYPRQAELIQQVEEIMNL